MKERKKGRKGGRKEGREGGRKEGRKLKQGPCTVAVERNKSSNE
jgi:hypothetical protein